MYLHKQIFYHHPSGDEGLKMPKSCLEAAVVQTWKNRETIGYSRKESPGLFFVLEGVVKQMYQLETGVRRLLYTTHPGYFLYEVHFFCVKDRDSFAVADGQVKTAFFSREAVYKLVDTAPDFCKLLIRSSVDKLLQSSTNQVDAGFTNTSLRLLHVLRRMGAQNGNEVEGGREIAYTQEELAEIMGVHRVTINRVLNKLARDGDIIVKRNRLTVLENGRPER